MSRIYEQIEKDVESKYKNFTLKKKYIFLKYFFINKIYINN